MSIALVLGSVGREQIQNRYGTSGVVFGGTAFYGAAALAKQNISTLLVSVLGNDLSKRKLRSALGPRVNLDALSVNPHLPSFFWDAEYQDDLETVNTRYLENRLFDSYTPDWTGIAGRYPKLKWAYQGAFLPEIQLACINNMHGVFSLVETIGYWIKRDRQGVLKAFAKADGVVVNQSEFQELWECDITPGRRSTAGNLIQHELSLRFLIVTFGSSGAQTFTSDGTFFVPAVNVATVDTTGAGNVFCGGLLGQLIAENTTELPTLIRATVNGVVLAGAQVADFGDAGLRRMGTQQVIADSSSILSRVCMIA